MIFLFHVYLYNLNIKLNMDDSYDFFKCLKQQKLEYFLC
jgi:hypothetical protein